MSAEDAEGCIGQKSPFSFSQEFLHRHWSAGEFWDEETLPWKVDTTEWKNEPHFRFTSNFAVAIMQAQS